MFTPTMSLPEDLMASGTVLAMVSTLDAEAAVVVVDGAALSSFLAQPDRANAPVAANTTATRQTLVRLLHPTDTIPLSSSGVGHPRRLLLQAQDDNDSDTSAQCR